MTILRSIVMAFSLFSRIPMPHIDWKPESMRYMLAAFPLIGLIIGLIIGAWIALCNVIGLDYLVIAVGITLVPLLVTGGIHLDGFCDVVDAQSSHAEPARKREIMKDPHIGAFAAIGVVCYVLAYFAFATQLGQGFAQADVLDASGPPLRAIAMLIIVHVLTRTGSGIASTAFPKASDKGMLAMEHDSADKKPVLIALGIIATICVVACIFCWPVAGIAIAVSWGISLIALRTFALQQFEGMSGDVAGFYLQATELALIIILAIAQLVA